MGEIYRNLHCLILMVLLCAAPSVSAQVLGGDQIKVPTPRDISQEEVIERSNAEDRIYAGFEKLSLVQQDQLNKIEPSDPDGPGLYYPCSVELVDGTVIENAIIRNMDAYLREGGILFDIEGAFASKFPVTEIKRIFPSKNRLPIEFSKEIHTYWETGMGYLLFHMSFDDGSKKIVAGGAATDFYDLPAGYALENIVKVEPFDRETDVWSGETDILPSEDIVIFRFRESDIRPSTKNPFYEINP